MADVWDYNAFLDRAAQWDAPVGSTVSTEVLRSRFLWHVDLKSRGRETIVTDLGDLPAMRIDGRTYKLERNGKREPDATSASSRVWISDDDGRVPLQQRRAHRLRRHEDDRSSSTTPGTGKRPSENENGPGGPARSLSRGDGSFFDAFELLLAGRHDDLVVVVGLAVGGLELLVDHLLEALLRQRATHVRAVDEERRRRVDVELLQLG